MTPGELDQLVNILRYVKTPDGMGGNTSAPTVHAADVWCKARSLSGNELERYDRVNATAMVVFIFRHRTDLLSTDRILWQGIEHNIRHIHPTSERHLYLVVEAERGVAQ